MAQFHRLLSVVPRLWGNWISLLGTTLATIAGNAILIITVLGLVTDRPNKYTATLGYLLMPLVFVLGLLFIAYGNWRDYRRKRTFKDSVMDRALTMVMDDPPARRRLVFVVAATFINLTLISVAAFKGIIYMDSPEFCGQLCHSVMKAEYRAYLRSPHARVPCVDCHIGEGADWFARSKLSGLRQVWATLTGGFNRPIPAPIHQLRPARETCERCHWTAKFHGERLLVRHRFKNDEHNTRLTNVVRLNVGGINRRSGRYEGIHWHVAPEVQIVYEALDSKRKAIGKVTLVQNGKESIYAPPKVKQRKSRPVFERRVMDCVDCHNRPTHIYDPSPEVSVDRALSLGKLEVKLPFLRQRAVLLLKRRIADPRGAARLFTRELLAYYSKRHPDVAKTKARAIEKVGRELGWIYRRNIYPDLKIYWKTYPDHIGHRQTDEGCFRCHDDEHNAGSEKAISQDCDLCHEVLAEAEESPDVPESTLRLGRF